MPSLTGTLDDNATELVHALLGNLADLPFNAFFVQEAVIGVASSTTPEGFKVVGSPWPPLTGSPWRDVMGGAWNPVPGTGWSDVGGSRSPAVGGNP